MRTQRVALPRTSQTAFVVAAIAGLLHATPSVYWALGGRWQLESVGDWAVRLADDQPLAAGFGLAGLGFVKAAAAVAPLVNERRKSFLYRPIRFCGWVGAVVFVAWGGLSTLSAWSVLAGVITPTGGYNRTTMLGHGVVWDPLFVIWGGALMVGLCL